MTPKCPDCKRDQDDCVCSNQLLAINKTHVLLSTYQDLEAKLKVVAEALGLLRDSAVRYLDAEDMGAKMTCDRELLLTLEKIKAK